MKTKKEVPRQLAQSALLQLRLTQMQALVMTKDYVYHIGVMC